MDCMCGAGVALNTKRIITDTWQKKKSTGTNKKMFSGERKQNREKKKEQQEFTLEGKKENKVITIPVTTSTGSLCSDPRFLEQRSKAAPKGLMGRQRSTTPFLTHHMLKEFSSALWDMTLVTPTTKFPNY